MTKAKLSRLVAVLAVALTVVSVASAATQRTNYVGVIETNTTGTITSDTWASTSSYAYRDKNTASISSGSCLSPHVWLRVRYVNTSGGVIQYNDAPRGACPPFNVAQAWSLGQYAKSQCKLMVDAGYGPVSRQGNCWTDWH